MNRHGSYRNELQESIRIACVLEATARKPGNVHPEVAFPDLTYEDFLRSAEVIAPVLAGAQEQGIGRTILTAIDKTQAVSPRNSNLGIVLLLAPLAAVPADSSLKAGIGDVLAGLTREDAVLAYRAIRLVDPGGMGEVPEQDLSREPDVTLLEAMQLAADRDSIAAQYATGFDLVLNFGVPLLENVENFAACWEETIIKLHLQLMAQTPDTLIARKCGPEVALQAAQRAQLVLEAGWPATDTGKRELDELDVWLRSDGHRRNPGTTADLVAATLFAALRERRIIPPKLDEVLFTAESQRTLRTNNL